MNQTNNNLTNSAASLAKNKLLMDCYRHMQTDDLVLPTIPDVSFKIRRAINDDNSSISTIARVVQIDPSITARLIQIANSPFYMGRKKIESCPEALTRLGLKSAQDIITSFDPAISPLSYLSLATRRFSIGFSGSMCTASFKFLTASASSPFS